jgi:hypothetical protein
MGGTNSRKISNKIDAQPTRRFPTFEGPSVSSLIERDELEEEIKDIERVSSVAVSCVGDDLAVTLLLCSRCDASCAFARLPSDVISTLVAFFIPSTTASFLHCKPLARSYYKICERMVRLRETEEWSGSDYAKSRNGCFTLSITEYRSDSPFRSKVNLIQASKQVLRFFVQLKHANFAYPLDSMCMMSFAFLFDIIYRLCI